MAIITTRLTEFGRTESKFHETGTTVWTDANKSNGGKGEYPNPVYMLCQAFAACTLTVICMAAKRMDVDLTGASVDVDDVEEDMETFKVTHIDLTVHLSQSLEPATRKRLEAFARRGCFVGNTLTAERNVKFVYE